MGRCSAHLTPATGPLFAKPMPLAEGERNPGRDAPGVQGGGGGRGGVAGGGGSRADGLARNAVDETQLPPVIARSPCDEAIQPTTRADSSFKQRDPTTSLRAPARQSLVPRKSKNWIASSQGLLAMTMWPERWLPRRGRPGRAAVNSGPASRPNGLRQPRTQNVENNPMHSSLQGNLAVAGVRKPATV